MRHLRSSGRYPWSAHQKRHSDVKFEWKTLALYQAKLAQMVPVVGRVNYVCVLQLAQVLQLLVHTLHGHVNALQRLQPLCHQQISESTMHRFHFLSDSQYPLLVWIRCIIVSRCAAKISTIGEETFKSHA